MISILEHTARTVATLSEITGLSRHGVGIQLEALGLEPYVNADEIARRVSAINAIVAQFMLPGVAWEDVAFSAIAKKLLEQKIIMSPKQVKNFIARHREKYFSHLPPRRLTTEEIVDRNRNIFRDYATGINQLEVAEKYGLVPEAVSEILRGDPPLDQEGKPLVYEPRGRRTFSPTERQRILDLYNQQVANGTAGVRGSLVEIVEAVNKARLVQGDTTPITKDAVYRIIHES